MATTRNGHLDFITSLQKEILSLFSIVKNKQVNNLLASPNLTMDQVMEFEQSNDYLTLSEAARNKYDALFGVALELIEFINAPHPDYAEFKIIMKVKIETVKNFSQAATMQMWKHSTVEAKAKEILENFFSASNRTDDNIVILPKRHC